MHKFQRDYDVAVVPEFKSFEAFVAHQGGQITLDQAKMFVEDGRLLIKRIMETDAKSIKDLNLPPEFDTEYALACLQWLSAYQGLQMGRAMHKGMYVFDLGSQAKNDLLYSVMIGEDFKSEERTLGKAVKSKVNPNAVGIARFLGGFLTPSAQKARRGMNFIMRRTDVEPDKSGLYTRAGSHFNSVADESTLFLGMDATYFELPWIREKEHLKTSLIVKLNDGRVSLKAETAGTDTVNKAGESLQHAKHFAGKKKINTESIIGRREDAVDDDVYEIVLEFIEKAPGNVFDKTRRAISIKVNEIEEKHAEKKRKKRSSQAEDEGVELLSKDEIEQDRKAINADKKEAIRKIIYKKLGYNPSIRKKMAEAIEASKGDPENGRKLVELKHAFEISLQQRYGKDWEKQYGSEVTLRFQDSDIAQPYFTGVALSSILEEDSAMAAPVARGEDKHVNLLEEILRKLEMRANVVAQMKPDHKDRFLPNIIKQMTIVRSIQERIKQGGQALEQGVKSHVMQALYQEVNYLFRPRKNQRTLKNMQRIENIFACIESINSIPENLGLEQVKKDIAQILTQASSVDKSLNQGSRFGFRKTSMMELCSYLIRELPEIKDKEALERIATTASIDISGMLQEDGKAYEAREAELEEDVAGEVFREALQFHERDESSEHSFSDTDALAGSLSDRSPSPVHEEADEVKNSPRPGQYDNDLKARVLRNNIDYLMALYELKVRLGPKIIEYNSSHNELIHTTPEVPGQFYVNLQNDTLFQGHNMPHPQAMVEAVQKQIAMYLQDRNPVVGIHKRYAELNHALTTGDSKKAFTLAHDLHAKTAPKAEYLVRRICEADSRMKASDFPGKTPSIAPEAAARPGDKSAFLQLKHDYTRTGFENQPAVEMIKLSNAEVEQNEMINWFNQEDRAFTLNGKNVVIKADAVQDPFRDGTTIGFFKVDSQGELHPLSHQEAQQIGAAVMGVIKQHLDEKQRTLTAESHRKPHAPK